MSDRDAFREARAIGKAKHHEQRLEHATYTAAEVKVLTEVALRLGRKEAAEEIAARIKAEINDYPSYAWNAPDIAKGLGMAYVIADTFTSQPAASDAISGVPRHSEVSEAPKAPQKPPKLVCRRCNGYGLLGVTAGVNPVPCPDCAKGDT